MKFYFKPIPGHIKILSVIYFTLHVIHLDCVNAAEQTEFEVSACSSSSPSKLPNCTIVSSNPFPKVECLAENTVKVWRDHSKNNVDYTHVLCNSNRYMVVDAVFENGTPNPFRVDSYVHLKRFARNVSDSTTYIYHLTLETQPGRIVHYRIRNQEDEQDSAAISILIFNNIWPQGVWWMANANVEVYEFEANQEVVTVPCVPELKYVPGMLNIADSHDIKVNLTELTVDNSSITYTPSDGFNFNLTAMTDYNEKLFRCTSGLNSYWDFRIVDLPDLKLIPTPTTDDKIYRLFASQRINRANIIIECNYGLGPVRLEGTLTKNSYVVAENSSESISNFYWNTEGIIPLEDSWGEDEETPILNQTRNIVNPYPKLRHIGIYANTLRVFDRLVVNCLSQTDGKLLDSWDVRVHDVGPQNTGTQYLKFVYPTRNKVGDTPADFEYQCYSRVYKDIRLKSIQCSNVFQCELIKKCFDDEYRCRNVVLEGTTCPESPFYPTASCQESRALSPGGLTLCTGGGAKYLQLHFIGFDGVIYNYYDTEYKKNPKAIIKLENPGVDTIYTGELLKLTARVHQFFSEGEIHFYWVHPNGSVTLAEKIEVVYQNATELVPYSENVTLLVRFANPKQIPSIMCIAPALHSPTQWIQSFVYRILVEESTPPTIVTNSTERNIQVGEEGQTLECKAEGLPLPAIKWSWTSGMNENDFEIFQSSNDTSVLKFSKFLKSMEGIYTCNATNVAGTDLKDFYVTAKKDTKLLVAILSTCAGVVIMLVPLIILFLRYRRARGKLIKLDEAELATFWNGTIGEWNAETGINGDDLIGIPFKKEFEVKKEDILYIDETKPLGKGKFGEVYLSGLKGIDDSLAVKMTTPKCPDDIFKALLKELKIMTHLGEHENILLLRGAYVAEINIGKLYIFTELCVNGDLEKYLQRNAIYFSDKPKVTPNPSSPYQRAMEFGPAELLRWSSEIANGMVFISNLKIVHRDISARNILLTGGLTAKIGDFGLSRRLYQRVNYVKVGEEYIPWRWFAIESFLSNTFSTQTDIWSYGILLYEIYSLGNEPYPGLSWSIDFGNKLDMGLRNLKPQHATEEIYEVMKVCWSKFPEDRPSFQTLSKIFNHFREPTPESEAKISHYIFSRGD